MFERDVPRDGGFGRANAEARVDRGLLAALTQALAYRGPDAREVWVDGPMGFGHTLLRTTRESGVERQPAQFEGRYWITADARIDSRSELEAELAQAGYKVRQPMADCELILRAYAAWGERCVEYLRGDFAFAIWDTREQRLFCARDHFGVKPFYYAEFGSTLIFSNTLNCLRMHPEFSGDLNEEAIADFLLFGVNTDAATTTFAEIRRLPPAHTLTATASGVRAARYWKAPVDGAVRHKRPHEYEEELQRVLQAAVLDRLRTDRLAILLSGGLDSASVAAVAREVTAPSRGEVDLRAFTVTYAEESAAEETAFARKTAGFLNLPHEAIELDEVEPFEQRGDAEFAYPEPLEDAFFSGLFEQYRTISGHARVALSGEGADNLMHFQMWPFASSLLREKRYARFAAAASSYLSVRRFPWRGIRYRINSMLGRNGGAPVFPSWIAPDFARRMNLADRWRHQHARYEHTTHPILPKAHASLSLPQWQQMFEASDPGVTRNPVEVRYPFLDLRVVNYVLGLPAFPWIYEKAILREAMIGKLPEAVRTRPKKPLASDPLAAKVRRYEEKFAGDGAWSEEIEAYISRMALAAAEKKRKGAGAAEELRPLCLNFWLQTARRLRYNIVAEARNA
jgi:asparagine synthase (glutamine-hydrolysing)